MEMSLDRFLGKCRCGREHGLQTKIAVIGEGALGRLREIVLGLPLAGRGCIVCDGNTERYAGEAASALEGLLSAQRETIALDAAGLHADEIATADVEAALPGDAGWLLAAGSGTIHDITRFVAAKKGLPFVAFPTAASVDGFVSDSCAMTWHGFKRTMPGVPPLALVADTAVFSRAPYRLSASGIGDVLGKYISLADWEIAHILIGEGFCPEIRDISREAVDSVMAGLDAVRAGDPAAYERLMYAQVLSGIAMQLWGSTRPASGAEHHLSHLWEMEVVNPHIDALHGEKVGVGLLVCLERYAALAAVEDIAARLVPYGGFPEERLREAFGGLYGSLREENGADLLLEVDTKRLAERYGEIRAILKTLPGHAEMRGAMERAGCKTTPDELGLDPAILPASVELSPFVRRRLTMLRLIKLTDLS